MRSECRVYSGPEASYRIFPPDLLRSEQHTLVFVYHDTVFNRLKAWFTTHQLKAHGSIAYQVIATPYIDHKGDGFRTTIKQVVSLNVGQATALVRLEKGYSRIKDVEWDEQS
jgi:hypothetical protein